MPYLNSDIPTFWCHLDSGFLHDTEPTGQDGPLVEVFAVTSIPRRCLMFSAMSDMGSQHARVPIHYLRLEGLAMLDRHPLHWLQLWDCFSPYFSVVRHDYLKNSRCTVVLKDRSAATGRYLFTIDWCNGPEHQTGYSEMASGHKSGHVIALANGQLACQPNNRVVWHDGGAFIGRPLEGHERWEVFSREFSCEAAGWKWTAGTEELMFYQFEERA